MEIRGSLIIVVIIGSLLALPDISSCLPASRHQIQGWATSFTSSASTKTAIRRYMAFPKFLSRRHQKHDEEIISCKIILWKPFCMVRFVQATTSSPTTTETTPVQNNTGRKGCYATSDGGQKEPGRAIHIRLL